jgi:hypothetical protein
MPHAQMTPLKPAEDPTPEEHEMDAVTPAPPTPSPLALVIARVWPGPSATASRQALLAVTGVVAVAAIALVPNRPGLG